MGESKGDGPKWLSKAHVRSNQVWTTDMRWKIWNHKITSFSKWIEAISTFSYSGVGWQLKNFFALKIHSKTRVVPSKWGNPREISHTGLTKPHGVTTNGDSLEFEASTCWVVPWFIKYNNFYIWSIWSLFSIWNWMINSRLYLSWAGCLSIQFKIEVSWACISFIRVFSFVDLNESTNETVELWWYEFTKIAIIWVLITIKMEKEFQLKAMEIWESQLIFEGFPWKGIFGR